MTESWNARIERADRLAAGCDATRELLTFYGALLRAQKAVYEALRRRSDGRPSGRLADDVALVRAEMPTLLRAVAACGPAALVEEARALLRANRDDLDQLLLEHWRAPSDAQFFAKAQLQPYASWLAESGVRPRDREVAHGDNRCPFCGGRPQVSVLRAAASGTESGGRDLICATCLTAWEFRRVICASCGEQEQARLGYFQAPEFEHVRIEVCDACGHYLKGIDLTRLGLAVPLVDDVASSSLDLWACEHGYTKIELNLVGL